MGLTLREKEDQSAVLTGRAVGRVAPGTWGTARAIPRLTRVLRVLVRHGFVGALRGERRWPSPAQVREALEELGIVYLKFGQVLALRRDLLPTEYVTELERLHDRLPPMEFPPVRETVEHALGASLEELFVSFDHQPLAAATIAQVHAATLGGGAPVVVKVRRPGLERRISEDIATLTVLAAAAERVTPALRVLDLIGMVRAFRDSLRRETDFRLEARTIRRFRAALADVPGVWIPDVVDGRSGEAVLTMEHSPGVRIDEYAVQHPEASHTLATNIAAVVLHQVFETGLFHADPHPGNVFVLPDGRICLHDFGMVGELGEAMRGSLIRVLEAVVRDDARALTDAYLELGLAGDDVDRAALETDLAAFLRRVRARPLAEISVGDALASLVRIGGHHTIRHPGEVLLLARAFLIAEAVMRHLDPTMNVIAAFQAEMERVAIHRYSPDRLGESASRFLREAQRMAEEGPRDARRALRRLGDGEIGRVHAPALEALGRRLTRDAERLTGAVAAGALVVGGALLATRLGWHAVVGDILLGLGLVTTAVVALGALRGERGYEER